MPQDILITPYKDSTSSGAKIDFTGFNSGASTITMRVLPDSTLSYEGTAGQLFSISNGLSSGTIFSVNDISGIPSIDVASSGLVRLAPFVGEVQTNKLYVQANPQSGTQTVQEWRNLSGTAMASVNTSGVFNGYLSSGMAINNVIANPIATSGLYYLDFTPTLSGSAGTFTSSGLVYNPRSGGTLGIGNVTNPTSRLTITHSDLYPSESLQTNTVTLGLYSGGTTSGFATYGNTFVINSNRGSSNLTTYAVRVNHGGAITSGTTGFLGTIGGMLVDFGDVNGAGSPTHYGIRINPHNGGLDGYGLYVAGGGANSNFYGIYSTATGFAGGANYGIYAESSNTGGIRAAYGAQIRIAGNVTSFARGLVVDAATATISRDYYGAVIDATNITALSGKIGLYVADGTSISTFGNGTVAASFTGGNVGIRTSTPSGTLHVETGSATRIGAIVRGFTSQTANLTEWQNSAGTVLSVVNASGSFGLGTSSPAYRLNLVGGNEVGSRFSVTGTYAPVQFTGDGSTTVGGVNAYSNIVTFGRGTATGVNPDIVVNLSGSVGIGTTAPGGQFQVTNSTAGLIPAIIRGATSQTANLLELQDSAGNYVGAMNAGGSLSFEVNSPNISGTVSNLVTSGSYFVRLNCTWSGSALTGVAPITGGSHVNGKLMRLYNGGSQPMKLTNMATSTATNRFYCYNSGDLWLSVGDYYECIYDTIAFNGTSSGGAWRVNA